MRSRTGRADTRCWLVLGLLASAYLIVYYLLPRLQLSSFVRTYVLQSALWVSVALAIRLLGSYRPSGRIGLRPTIVQIALAAGLFQIVLYSIGGLFNSFGSSSNSFAPVTIAGNIIYVAGNLVGMETSRAWLMNHLGKRTFVNLAMVTTVFTVLSIAPGQLLGLRPNASSLDFVTSTLLPALASGLLASYLALLAGPMASLSYMGLLQAFWWFLPILPDLSWAFKGLIGTVVPIVALTMLHSYYVSKTDRHRALLRSEGSAGGWVAVSIFSVALVWFAVGIFPVRPSLVGSGSMTPALAVGDIAIVLKVPTEAIRVGDIIDFKMAKRVDVIHRVVAINRTKDGVEFVTKGDANDAADAGAVVPDNVIGKVVLTARKAGWPAVVIKNAIFQRTQD